MFSTHHIAFLQWPLGHVCPGIASTYFRREASGALERAWTLPLRWRVIATMKRIVEWTNPDQSSASALMHLFWSFVNSRWISLIRRQLIKQAQDFWACEFQNGYSYWWTAHLHHVQLQVNARQTAVADEPGAQNPSIHQRNMCAISYHPIPIFGLSENMVQLYLNFPSSFIMIFPSADVLEPR
jgi:hypothetical protein